MILNSTRIDKNLIILGCGTSYHAGLLGLEYFKELTNFNTVQLFDGAEFDLKDIPKQGITGLLLLSQSGETKDLHRCIEIAQSNDAITLGVVNVPDSLIARETDCGVYLNAGREFAVASTKSFTCQCIVLSLISIWFSQNRKNHIKMRNQFLESCDSIIKFILPRISFKLYFVIRYKQINSKSYLTTILIWIYS